MAEVAALTLASLPPFVSGTQMTLGRNDVSSSPQYGAGAIDEFAIYRRVLSEEELAQHVESRSLQTTTSAASRLSECWMATE